MVKDLCRFLKIYRFVYGKEAIRFIYHKNNKLVTVRYSDNSVLRYRVVDNTWIDCSTGKSVNDKWLQINLNLATFNNANISNPFIPVLPTFHPIRIDLKTLLFKVLWYIPLLGLCFHKYESDSNSDVMMAAIHVVFGLIILFGMAVHIADHIF